ncbi:MAG: fibronectin type III domain-containing protein [Bacteroidia bacterium]|nr:fibronectin type III domain-containing protein [Bacteroidia bacterium]MDW8159408.1 fibronectin type III domain-containing protein [Bacteroidia bacterium]
MKLIFTLLAFFISLQLAFSQMLPEGPMRVSVRLKKAYADASSSFINLDPYELIWRLRLIEPQGTGINEHICLSKNVPEVPNFSDDVDILLLEQFYNNGPAYLLLESTSWEEDCGERCEFDNTGFPCSIFTDDDFCQHSNFRFDFRSLGPPCQWVENWISFNCPQSGFERRNLLASYYTPPLPRSIQFFFNNAEVKSICSGQQLQIRASQVFLNWPLSYRWQIRKRSWDGLRWRNWSDWETLANTTTSFLDYLPELGEAQRMEIQIRVQTHAGCPSEGFTESIILPVYAAPETPTISSSISICGNNRAIFQPQSSNAQEVILYNTQGVALDSTRNQPFFLTVWQTRPEVTYWISARNGNCESRKVDVVATLRPLPPEPIANDAYRCGPGSVTFTVSNAINLKLNLYASYNASSPLVSSMGPFINSPSISTNTVFFLETENIFGCKSDARMPAMALLAPPPNFELNARDVERCGPGVVTFTVSASGSVRLFSELTGGNAIAQANTPPYLLTTPFISTTTTFYIETGQGDCISFRRPVVAKIAAGTFFDAGQDQTITCGSSVVLNATAGGTNYRWLPVTGLNNPTGASTVANPVQTTTYTVSAILDGCEVSDTVRVIVEPAPINITASAQNICSGGSTQLSASMPGNATFIWSPPTGLSSTTGNSVIATPTSTITYTVSVLRGSCRNSGTITISVRPPLSLSTIVAGNEVTLIGSGGIEPYFYSLGGPFQQSPIFRNVAPGTYTATVRDLYGCLANEVVNIRNCPAPMNLQVNNEGIVSWNAVAGVEGYEIQVKDNNNWSSPIFVTTTTYLLRGYSGLIEVRVRSRCSSNLFSEHASTLWQVPEECPSVAQITITNITNNSAAISYTPVTGAVAYRVEYRQPPANWILVTTTSATTVTLTGLSPYTEYQVRVATLCSGGNVSPADKFSTFRTLLNCNAPLALTATDVTPTQARLTWIETPNAIGYMLTYQCGNNPPVALRVNPPYILAGLTPGSICTLRVRSICDPNLPLPDGLSPWSESITLRVPAARSSIEQKNFSIYPNPALQGKFNITIFVEKEEKLRFEIWNIAGNLLWQNEQSLEEGLHVLPFHLNLASGLYLIKVIKSDDIYTARLKIE